MKSCTDLEQSRKLAKILPLESADMWYCNENPNKITVGKWEDNKHDEDDIPCWSLAALIDVLPADWWGYSEHYFLEISKMGDASKPNEVRYFRFRKDIDGANYGRITHISHSAENLVDACVSMIELLHELKML